ncbi:DUF4357 domain-containing protein [Planococcus salinus]|uniref:Methionine sulfoxide reductase n=1 Tax=Planococcus salinus TaxID=1848460 RepID=A0A3M8P7Z9_9BACL|nr:DUF4357 domain-containing protein [Planococcus salinus]RNF39752.1 methionine sulfoxide reductase [Planococcus salinus]
MNNDYHVKKVFHPAHGEFYQFFKIDQATGQETAVSPFDAGMFQPIDKPPQPEILSIVSKRGADASGYYTGDKFTVIKGSKFAASTSPRCPERYIQLREDLVLEGLLVPIHNQLLLMEDVEFVSPTNAMGAVIGGWVRGPHGWR